jgi:hypothetical protein
MLELLLWVHIAAGMASIPLGTLAVAARKGGWLHARAGTGFFGSILVLGVSAAILERFRMPEPGSMIPPLLVCYFVLTSWVTSQATISNLPAVPSRRRAAVALGAAAVIAWTAFEGGAATTPIGRGPVFIFAAVSLLAGLLDLNAILRSPLSGKQRIGRHLWRMCVAFFIATGSFFLGQRDVLPAAVRGSPWLFAPAFAPLAVMLFWLVRLRFAKAIARSKETGRMLIGRRALAQA